MAKIDLGTRLDRMATRHVETGTIEIVQLDSSYGSDFPVPKPEGCAMSRRSRRISGPDVHAPAGVGPFADIGSAPACGGIGRQTRGRLQRLYRIAVKIAIFSDKHCWNSPAVSRPSRRALRIVLAAPSDMLRLR
ncbi:hypothetical protein BQ8482_180008 [Mesorhizobium delmotii]|uniref:Uncharacterized protein n=1 Tax=Mesorhizobium delmotii TaxID=1631247 RepID=A0A2P9AI23_9HYPH|nr:hypothetical protein BQ8482_180008 [Mesorhizobium delmotii]